MTLRQTMACLALAIVPLIGTAADDANQAALMKAAGEGDVAEIQRLIASGAKADAVGPNGITALHQAKTAEAAFLLIEKGAPVGAKSKGGYMPLHNAVSRGLKDVAAALLDKGADPNAALENGRTPLMLCAERKRLEITRALLAKG